MWNEKKSYGTKKREVSELKKGSYGTKKMLWDGKKGTERKRGKLWNDEERSNENEEGSYGTWKKEINRNEYTEAAPEEIHKQRFHLSADLFYVQLVCLPSYQQDKMLCHSQTTTEAKNR